MYTLFSAMAGLYEAFGTKVRPTKFKMNRVTGRYTKYIVYGK